MVNYLSLCLDFLISFISSRGNALNISNLLTSFIFLLCLSLSGCDYLDTEPGDVISSDHFWETANSAALEQYCNTYYPKLIKGHGDPLAWTIGNMIESD